MKIDGCVLAYTVYAAGQCERLRAAAAGLSAGAGREALPPFLSAFPPYVALRHARLYGFLSQADAREVAGLLGRGFPFVRHICREQGFVDMLLSLGIRGRHEELLEYFAVYAFVKQSRFLLSMAEVMAGDADELALFEELSMRTRVGDRPEVRQPSSRRFIKDMRGACLADWFAGREGLYKILSRTVSLGGLSPLAISAPLAMPDISAAVESAEMFLGEGKSAADLKEDAGRYQELLSLCALVAALCRAYREADAFAWAEHERAESLTVKAEGLREEVRREGEAELRRLEDALAERQSRLNEMQLTLDKLRLRVSDAEAQLRLLGKDR